MSYTNGMEDPFYYLQRAGFVHRTAMCR